MASIQRKKKKAKKKQTRNLSQMERKQRYSIQDWPRSNGELQYFDVLSASRFKNSLSSNAAVDRPHVLGRVEVLQRKGFCRVVIQLSIRLFKSINV